MLKGLTITPPVLGRISIGKVIEKSGKRLPEKDDQFTITSQVQTKEGWLPHPIDDVLRKEQGGKIRHIPIRLLFNDPELNFRVGYTLFDRSTGRPLCVGNGEISKRQAEEGVKSFPCPSPDGCPLAKGNACKPYGRLNVALDSDDPLGSFIFRTTGFNSIRTLSARLQYFQAISGNRLSCLALELRLRGKSTRQSLGTPIYYVDITPRAGATTEQMLDEARQCDESRRLAGFDQVALDQAARLGLINGAFEDGVEDGEAVVDEFFGAGEISAGADEQSMPSAAISSLGKRLEEKVAAVSAEKSAEG